MTYHSRQLLRSLCLVMMLFLSSFAIADNRDNRLPMDDGAVASIQSEVILNDNLSNVNINVTCDDGVVELSGEVDSYAQQNEVIGIAHASYGVTEVDATKLVVNPY